MVKVEAIIRPNKLDEVKAALDELGVRGMTVSQVMGAGTQRGRTQYYRGQELVVNLLEKTKLETVVADSMAHAVADVIAKHAYTGEIGDGKIFMTRVENAIRIRTGEKGESAVS